MSSNKIEIIAILDRSGSMGETHKESVSSFNAYIKEQQEAGIKAKVTLVMFDDKVETVFSRVKLKDVKEVDVKDWPVRGMTSLNDAIGMTLTRAKDRRTIVHIMTDGAENASQEYRADMVKQLVQSKEDKGWKFTFFGAGINAFDAGSQYGMAEGSYHTVAKSAGGMVTRGVTMSADTVSFANAGK